tara:strand:- start:25183 stop:26193 length:1011 start_codon:yes stop_codon:yes gene_type:complete
MNSFQFGSKFIGGDNPVYIISEIGINHEGSISKCKELIEQSKDAGADAVKLQTINPDLNYAPDTESYKVFKQASLSNDDTAEIFEFAKELKIDCFSTCGDFETLKFLRELNPAGWKISSGLVTHIPLIEEIISYDEPILFSSGMTGLRELEEVVSICKSNNKKSFGIFQCTSLYPAPFESLNLNCIKSLENKFDCVIGFSDHSNGILAASIAVSLGAKMIEKHFTYDSSRDGFDHKISLEHDQFKKMVLDIRNTELMLGSSEKNTEQTNENSKKYLRRVTALRKINKGEVFSTKNIGVLRVNQSFGEQPKELNNIIGKSAKNDLEPFTPISNQDHL